MRARLVRHLLGTRNDGLVPSLMASDFRANTAGRAKTADFLSQVFAPDPKHDRSLRAKAWYHWPAAGPFKFF